MPNQALEPATILRGIEELQRDHSLSLDEWADLLRDAFPEEHDEPPLADDPHICLTRKARVAVLCDRAEEGQSLFHPEDLRREDTSWLRVAVRVDCHANYKPGEEHLVIEGGDY